MEVGSFFISEEVLGSGAFSEVRKGIDLRTGRNIAVKIVNKSSLTDLGKANLFREIAAHRCLKNRHIAELYDVKEDAQSVYMFMEYVAGVDLCSKVYELRCLSEDQAKKIFLQVLEAVDYCHSKQIIHRDIKLENILVGSDEETVKLIDFGFCETYKEDRFLSTFCGSPSFVAPEIVKRIPYDGRSSDVWSLGVVLYSMLFGKLPFGSDDDITSLFTNIIGQPVRFPKYPSISRSGIDLIKRMLNKTSMKRPTIAEIKRHPWFQERQRLDEDNLYSLPTQTSIAVWH